jgi:hypothetical protein
MASPTWTTSASGGATAPRRNSRISPGGIDFRHPQAAASGWNRGPAHTALARPAWWQYQGANWTSSWLGIATAASQHSADAFLEIIKAALYGSTASVSQGQRTKRYQELVVVALVACNEAQAQPPDNLLPELAKDAGPSLAPRPYYVLRALITELERRSVLKMPSM